MLNAGVEFPVDDRLQAAVFVREVVVEGFPGNAQLVAQIGNTDGRVRPLQKVCKEALFNLSLAAIDGCGTGIHCKTHISLHFWGIIQICIQICVLYRKSSPASIGRKKSFSQISENVNKLRH
jgi:hypothetical protein